ncbi:hypothetical protein A5634_25320 [Mycobacterium asiaticum]|uniref:LppI n=1 Tax=Mycobacterium asiaticum TaxID=1790 RepID=A0A1A3NXZ3_MYCAS|nr:hypothetical protein [Mycobacterium asiaticum]OBK25889.1 hypothetical protein A5634_25320 [Mycobacterium asiaticum]
MRIFAVVAGALLVAACSHTGGGPAPSRTSTSTQAAPVTTPAVAAAPTSGTAIAGVIAWIEAGHPADPARYQLDDNVAFSAPGGKAKCTTDAKHTAGLLSCLVDLTSPPPQPETAYGEWKGGWVDFDGVNLQVGAARADPGPFLAGTGAALVDGDSLSFGDYRCRGEQAGVVCVNYAHQSATRISAAGVEPYGCLRSVPPPDGVGIAFRCS